MPSQMELEQQIRTVDREVWQLLSRLPDVQATTYELLRDALGKKFPALPKPVEPDSLYISEYFDDTDIRYTDGTVYRQPLATQTSWEVVLAYLACGVLPTYDSGAMGFYRNAADLGDHDKIKPMAVRDFEDVVQQVGDSSASHYLRCLKAFWSSEQSVLGATHSPQRWLAGQMRLQRQGEARLLAADVTLSSATQALLERFLENEQQGTGALPGLFTLALGGTTQPAGIPVQGAIVVTDDPAQPAAHTPGPVLVLLPGQGVMSFDTGADYLQEMQAILTDEQQRAWFLMYVPRNVRDLLDAACKDVATTITLDCMTLHGSAFDNSLGALIAQYTQDIAETLQRRVQPAGPVGRTLAQIATEFESKLSASGPLESRIQRQVSQALARFLQPASAPDQRLWWAALNRYQHAVFERDDNRVPSLQAFLSQDFYETQIKPYARQQVQQQIKQDLGFDIDPDTLYVVTTQTVKETNAQPSSSLYTESILGTVKLRQSLTDVALRQIPQISAYEVPYPIYPPVFQQGFDQLAHANGQTLTLFDAEGRALPVERAQQLNHAYLTRMVDDVDVAARYQRFLKMHLCDGPEGQLRMKYYASVLVAQMQLDALDAKIFGTFLEDRNDRGYRWVQAVLQEQQQPSELARVEGHRLQVHALCIAGHPLRGVQVIAPSVSTAVPNIVLYTPEAPDNKHFQEYTDSTAMLAGFINNPLYRDYLLARVPLGAREEVRFLLEEGTRVNIRSVLGLFILVPTALTSKPLLEFGQGVKQSDISMIAAQGRWLDQHYRHEVDHIVANAVALTQTTEQAQSKARWLALNQGLSMSGLILPMRVMVPLSVLRMVKALLDAHAHWRRGDEQAAADVLLAIQHLGDTIGMNERTLKSPRLLSVRRELDNYTVPVSHIKDLTPNASGIYRDAQGSCFVRSRDGAVFPIKNDFKLGDRYVQLLNPRSRMEMGVFLAFDEQGNLRRLGEVKGGSGRKRNAEGEPVAGPSSRRVQDGAERRFALKQSEYAGMFKYDNSSWSHRNPNFPFYCEPANKNYFKQQLRGEFAALMQKTTAENIRQKITKFAEWGLTINLTSLGFFRTPGSVAMELKNVLGGLLADLVRKPADSPDAIRRVIEPMAGSAAYSNFVRVMGFQGDLLINDVNPLVSWAQREMVANPGSVRRYIDVIRNDLVELGKQHGLTFNSDLTIHFNDIVNAEGIEGSRVVKGAIAKEAAKRFFEQPGMSAFRGKVREYFNEIVDVVIDTQGGVVAIDKPSHRRASVIGQWRDGQLVVSEPPRDLEGRVFLAAAFYLMQSSGNFRGTGIQINHLPKGGYSLHLPMEILYRDMAVIRMLRNVPENMDFISSLHKAAAGATEFINQDSWDLLAQRHDSFNRHDLIIVSGHFNDAYITEAAFMQRVTTHLAPLNAKGTKVVVVNAHSDTKEAGFKAAGFRTFKVARDGAPTQAYLLAISASTLTDSGQ